MCQGVFYTQTKKNAFGSSTHVLLLFFVWHFCGSDSYILCVYEVLFTDAILLVRSTTDQTYCMRLMMQHVWLWLHSLHAAAVPCPTGLTPKQLLSESNRHLVCYIVLFLFCSFCICTCFIIILFVLFYFQWTAGYCRCYCICSQCDATIIRHFLNKKQKQVIRDSSHWNA